jgi:hypothetical protein
VSKSEVISAQALSRLKSALRDRQRNSTLE